LEAGRSRAPAVAVGIYAYTREVRSSAADLNTQQVAHFPASPPIATIAMVGKHPARSTTNLQRSRAFRRRTHSCS